MQTHLWTTDEALSRLEDGDLPDFVRQAADIEASCLRVLPCRDSDWLAHNKRFDWLVSTPWEAGDWDFDLREVETALSDSVFGQEKSVEEVLSYLAGAKSGLRPPVVCLTGVSGTGKTRIIKAISRGTGRPMLTMSGTAFLSFGSESSPSPLLRNLRSLGTSSPIIVVNEEDTPGYAPQIIQKMLDLRNGSQSPESFLGVRLGCSDALFFFCCRGSAPPDLDMEDGLASIRLYEYVDEDRLEIAKRFIFPETSMKMNIDPPLRMQKRVLQKFLDGYSLEQGASELRHSVEVLFRRLMLFQSRGNKVPVSIDLALMKKVMGDPVYKQRPLDKSGVGIVLGLAQTHYGGEVLPIEVILSHGSGQLLVTGSVGDVMRESISVAKSWLYANSTMFGVPSDALEHVDISVHAVEASVEKDGPSAGPAIALAIVSAVSGRKVRARFALTGELTLSGNILAIGGLQQKLVAAVNAGVRRVAVPAANLNDLKNLRGNVANRLKIDVVSHINQVLEIGLLKL